MQTDLKWRYTVCKCRDVPENKLVVFAELAEYAVDELSHCNVQPFRHSSFLLPAKVTKLPFRCAAKQVFVLPSPWR